MGFFNIVIYVSSAAGLLFILLNLSAYIRAFFCKTHKRTFAFMEGMVFIHIAFFVTIVAAFEGQQRYAFPVLIFFIYAILWLCERKIYD